jgi:hypothetical protein
MSKITTKTLDKLIKECIGELFAEMGTQTECGLGEATKINVKFPKAVKAFAVLLNQFPDKATQDAIISAARAYNDRALPMTHEPFDPMTGDMSPAPRDRMDEPQ